MNIKGDLFASSGSSTGNWPVRFNVGWAHNAVLNGSNNGASYGASSWLGEIASVGEVTDITVVFQDDASHQGTDTGSGTYSPIAETGFPVMPASLAAYKVDLMAHQPLAGEFCVGAINTAV